MQKFSEIVKSKESFPCFDDIFNEYNAINNTNYNPNISFNSPINENLISSKENQDDYYDNDDNDDDDDDDDGVYCKFGDVNVPKSLLDSIKKRQVDVSFSVMVNDDIDNKYEDDEENEICNLYWQRLNLVDKNDDDVDCRKLDLFEQVDDSTDDTEALNRIRQRYFNNNNTSNNNNNGLTTSASKSKTPIVLFQPDGCDTPDFVKGIDTRDIWDNEDEDDEDDGNNGDDDDYDDENEDIENMIPPPIIENMDNENNDAYQIPLIKQLSSVARDTNPISPQFSPVFHLQSPITQQQTRQQQQQLQPPPAQRSFQPSSSFSRSSRKLLL